MRYHCLIQDLTLFHLYDFNTQYSANKHLLELFTQLLESSSGNLDPNSAEYLITYFLGEYMKSLESREYLKMVFSEFVTRISKFNIDSEFENFLYGQTKQADISPSKIKREGYKLIKDYFQSEISPLEISHSNSIASSKSEIDMMRKSVIITKNEKRKSRVTSFVVSPEIFEEETLTPADRLQQVKDICINFLKRLDQYILFMPLTIRCFCKMINDYCKNQPKASEKEEKPDINKSSIISNESNKNSRNIIAKLLLKIWMEPIANPIQYGIADICINDGKYEKKVALILNVIKRLLIGDKKSNEINRSQLFLNGLIDENAYNAK